MVVLYNLATQLWVH